MHQLPPLLVDDTQVFDDITAAKQQPRRRLLQSVRGNIIAAYQQYADAAPAVENLPAVQVTEAQGAALVHAYEVETVPMAGLRAKLTGRVIASRCPFCGISETSTLDHYLPKEQHPQFAVFSRNLIPCCSACNTRKSKLVVDKNTNVRLFLHPYFDNIPDVHFISLEVAVLPNALRLSFGVIRPAGMTLSTFQHLRSHFRLLRLADRYRLMSLEHLRSRWRALARVYGDEQDADKVSTELLKEATDFEEDFGSNHWRAVLYRALSANRTFCDGGFNVLKSIQ